LTRILLTGATGFIGKALVRRLLDNGHEVVALSRGSHLVAAAETMSFDLLNASTAELGSALDGREITHCIHTAWYTNHSDYLTHEFNRSWVEASLRLEQAFRRCGGQRFVALGTLQEYDPSDGICVEYQTPLRPDTFYARCKLELFERLAERGDDFAWPRIFFTYGPGDRAGRLVQGMVERFSRGEAVGPKCGGLRRDYIHVDDLAGQLVRIALSSVQGAINTGTGEAPSLSEIFSAGALAFGRVDLALKNDETGGQQPLIQADLARFRSEVGKPEARSIEQGLADLVRGNR
jgi:nucleoside-diphosphate-sugar epimerase